MASSSDVAPAAAPLSSLALYRQSVPESDDLVPGPKAKRCPTKWGWWLVDGLTGEKLPAGCGAASCKACGCWAATRTAGAIGLANPERLVRLSLVGNDWQTRRARFRRATYELRCLLGPDLHWAYCVERNPRLTGFHAHCWHRGRFIPQRLLVEVCDSVGMGRNCDIRRWEPRGELSTAYGIKGLMYGLKGLKAGGQEQYLEENGGRLVHASRGYWLDGEGKPCGLGEARRAWGRLRTCEERAWKVRYEPKWEVKL